MLDISGTLRQFVRCDSVLNARPGVAAVLNHDMIPDVLRDYFARSPIALSLGAICDEHALLLANTSFCRLTGYAQDEVVGRNCRFLQHAQHDEVNVGSRAQIRAFLQESGRDIVRVPIVNVRRDGRAFVNLLYMSKLRDWTGRVCGILASQFDVSRAHPEVLRTYDEQLADAVFHLRSALADRGMVFDGRLITIANTASTIAHAKMTLARLAG